MKGILLIILFVVVIILFSLLIGIFFVAIASSNQAAMDFETNSTQYLSLANSDNLSPGTGDLTIEMQMRFETNNVFRYLYTDTGSVLNNDIYLALAITGKMGMKYADAQDDKVELAGVRVLEPGQWYHVAAVRRGTSAYLCINGEQDDSGSNTLMGAITVSDGAAPNIAALGGASTFDGVLDEVRIWKKAIPCESMKGFTRRQLGIVSPATSTSLTGYWRLNDTLEDLSVNFNDATNNNSTPFTQKVPWGKESFMFQ